MGRRPTGNGPPTPGEWRGTADTLELRIMTEIIADTAVPDPVRDLLTDMVIETRALLRRAGLRR
jgi:hypothetical protein